MQLRLARSTVLRSLTRPTALTVFTLLLALALIPLTSYPTSPGSDWLWYRNGIDRLVTGQPLYDPAWLLGPFNYLATANLYQFNQPPWMLPLVAPFVLFPEPLATYAWLAFSDAALLLALALVVPRWPLLIVAVLLLPPILMSLAWGNVEAMVALGEALWIVGRRRSSWAAETVGIVLASLKVVPAIPLILFSLRSRRWKAAALSLLVAGAITAAVSAASGRELLEQFVRLTANTQPVLDRDNLSPAAWLGGSSGASNDGQTSCPVESGWPEGQDRRIAYSNRRYRNGRSQGRTPIPTRACGIWV